MKPGDALAHGGNMDSIEARRRRHLARDREFQAAAGFHAGGKGLARALPDQVTSGGVEEQVTERGALLSRPGMPARVAQGRLDMNPRAIAGNGSLPVKVAR